MFFMSLNSPWVFRPKILHESSDLKHFSWRKRKIGNNYDHVISLVWAKNCFPRGNRLLGFWLKLWASTVSDCSLSDTFGFVFKCHRILVSGFFRKYTLCLGAKRPLFYNPKTHKDHQENLKKILNKPGEKDLFQEKINKKKENASQN